MEPVAGALRLYGEVADAAPLDWAWVEDQLDAAGTYWIVPRGEGHPHPRPVWGVWADGALHLSIGSVVVGRLLADDPTATVHLDSGTDVVILEVRADGVSGTAPDDPVIGAYDAKYDWHYTIDEYGPLTRLRPATVLAWRSAGWAGRDGFRQVGRWQLG